MVSPLYGAMPTYDAPAIGSALITPSNTANSAVYRSLWVTGAGDVHFTGADGNDDTWTVPSNTLIPVMVTRVYSTNTTATGIHGLV